MNIVGPVYKKKKLSLLESKYSPIMGKHISMNCGY